MSLQLFFSQLLVGLINGSFYALLSLGLAITFGVLRIANFAHGAHYMVGAFSAWMLLEYAGISFWIAFLLAPLAVAAFAAVFEKLLLARLYRFDHLYGLLLTLGAALVLEGIFLNRYGAAGLPYDVPEQLARGVNLGFMYLPIYRAWVVLVSVITCAGTWFLIERTRLGSYLRAATENPTMVGALGVNVPLLITVTYAFSAALAALAGLMAAPLYTVNPLMGVDVLIVIFAIVVIGGLGSIVGAIFTAYAIGIVEALVKMFYSEAAAVIVFFVMALVLLVRPAGLFGREA